MSDIRHHDAEGRSPASASTRAVRLAGAVMTPQMTESFGLHSKVSIASALPERLAEWRLSHPARPCKRFASSRPCLSGDVVAPDGIRDLANCRVKLSTAKSIVETFPKVIDTLLHATDDDATGSR
jgi:hypothetical protein